MGVYCLVETVIVVVVVGGGGGGVIVVVVVVIAIANANIIVIVVLIVVVAVAVAAAVASAAHDYYHSCWSARSGFCFCLLLRFSCMVCLNIDYLLAFWLHICVASTSFLLVD